MLIGQPLGGRSLRYAYMDHWRVDTPQGPLSQYTSVERFDAFLKQIAGVGYEAIETFDFHLPVLRDLFGSLEAARAHMQSRGIDRVLSLFHAVMYDARQSTPHVRATHDRMAGYAEHIMKSSAGLGVQNFIVMPAGLYFDVEPVTDDKIRACAELWNRIGKMTLEGYGVKTCCHHEFFCGIRSAEQLRKFYGNQGHYDFRVASAVAELRFEGLLRWLPSEEAARLSRINSPCSSMKTGSRLVMGASGNTGMGVSVGFSCGGTTG